jgi:hypothetical protein
MGLLSNLMGTGVDDPRFAATTQLAQGLLSSPRLMQGLSAGLGGYQQAIAQARQAKAVEEMRAMQLQQMRAQMEAQRQQQEQAGTDRKLTQQAFTPVRGFEANAASGIMGPRPEALAPVGKLPAFDPASFIAAGGSPELAFTLQKSLAPAGPVITKAGDVARDPRTGQVLWQNETAESVDPFIRMLKQSGIDPASPHGQQLIQARLRKETTHQPATSLTVQSGPRAFDTDLGKFAVDAFGKQRETAQAAAGVLQSVGEIRKAAQGGAYQGAGAEIKLGAAKALGALGMPYDERTVANSELFSAQANQFVLNSIKGLGANPSNADREFIEKTVPRLQTDPAALPLLLKFMEDKARAQVQSYNRTARQVQSRADYLPLSLEVTEPQITPATDGWGIRPVSGGK